MINTDSILIRPKRLLKGKPAHRREVILKSKRLAVLTAHADEDMYQVLVLDVEIKPVTVTGIHSGIKFGDALENLKARFGDVLIVFDGVEW